MPLITADDFRDRFDISSDFEDKRITPHIQAASRRLQKWVGPDNYASVAAKEDLQNAEAHLAYHFAIFGLHFGITSKGVIATSTLAKGEAIVRYLSPDETARLSQQMLELAREIAGDYITDTVEDTGFAVIGVNETGYEATTRSYGSSNC